jgi:hypothetical protein
MEVVIIRELCSFLDIDESKDTDTNNTLHSPEQKKERKKEEKEEEE